MLANSLQRLLTKFQENSCCKCRGFKFCLAGNRKLCLFLFAFDNFVDLLRSQAIVEFPGWLIGIGNLLSFFPTSCEHLARILFYIKLNPSIKI